MTIWNWENELDRLEPKEKRNRKWGWKITKDNIDTNRVGKEYGDYQGGKYKWRLKDDDGEIYYYFVSDIDPNDGTEHQVFAPLDWAMSDSGCTILEYRNEKTGKYEII